MYTSSVIIALLAAVTVAYASGPITVTVPGQADPWLAGMPTGASDCASSCDYAPGQSPVQAGVILTAGAHLLITASGGVSQDPSFPLVGPDGAPSTATQHDAGAANGIANIAPLPFSSLIGVFLDAAAPNTSPAPGIATDAANPGLKQPFLIGSAATVTVPAGATRLFLGTMDSVQWNNNPGSFTVQIGYNTCLLYDPTKAAKSGSTIPIKVELCSATGGDLSSAAITVHALSIVAVPGGNVGVVDDSGNANQPDNDFRFDATLGTSGGYIFNLSTKGLATGTYNLNFTTSADSLFYSVPFQVK